MKNTRKPIIAEYVEKWSIHLPAKLRKATNKRKSIHKYKNIPYKGILKILISDTETRNKLGNMSPVRFLITNVSPT